MFLSKFLGRLRREPPEREAYRQIVVQARQPQFYARLGVPDTVTGRFDMITLHAFLVLERLRGERDEKTARFAQELCDELFLDMDHNLREMGVGDVAVGKKVRKMAEVFYGHVGAYKAALEAPSEAALQEALDRNIHDGKAPPEALAEMAGYVRKALEVLRAQPVTQIRKGQLSFPPPPQGAGQPQGGEE